MRAVIRFCIAGLLGIGCASPAAWADDMPRRKPGLWEVNMHMAANLPPQTMKLCIDAATDAAMYKMGMDAAQGMCSHNDMHRSGNVVTMDSLCKMGETQTSTHIVITFSGDSAYKTDIKSHMDPPIMGRGEMAMTQDGKWTGPCPADMKPGDVVAPNGMKMNLTSKPGR